MIHGPSRTLPTPLTHVRWLLLANRAKYAHILHAAPIRATIVFFVYSGLLGQWREFLAMGVRPSDMSDNNPVPVASEMGGLGVGPIAMDLKLEEKFSPFSGFAPTFFWIRLWGEKRMNIAIERTPVYKKMRPHRPKWSTLASHLLIPAVCSHPVCALPLYF